ncbi:MAG: DUF58 domain-containing protein [Deltaproteobacteria bacterium]|nr:MAG: DUF58 domain-containing protein [Deltaproteobacteria bacterium]
MASAAKPRVGEQLLPIDWGAISPLRMKAKTVAEGVYAGAHRSRRRGSGVEFGGQRPYFPGDDLRFLDRRSLLRHDRLMVREFETDTDRALWLCLDTSVSMGFRGSTAPGAKLAYAALIAAALARVAISSGDPVGLSWLGVGQLASLPASFGLGAFERIVSRLELISAAGDLSDDLSAVERTVGLLARRVSRGSVIVVLSDLLDLPAAAMHPLVSIGSNRRSLVVVQVLDPVERDLGFAGKVRLRAIEGDGLVVTDADAVRREYQQRLEQHVQTWRRAIEGQGGRLVRACSVDDPVQVVRQVLQAAAEACR